MLRIAGIVVALVVAFPGSVRAEPPGNPRTPPGTWSEAGYQQLRFGMGPGDVEDALRKGEGPLYLDKALELATPMPGISLAAPGASRVAVAGRSATAVVLAFWQDQLYLVALVFTGGDPDPGNAAMVPGGDASPDGEVRRLGNLRRRGMRLDEGDLNVQVGISLEAKESLGGIEYKSIALAAKADQGIESFKKDPKKSTDQQIKDL
jgi:hypothetical protein